MEPTELLAHVAGILERMDVTYAVVGSMASTFFGEARLTNDVDILADLRPEHVASFIGFFPADEFYVSEDAARAAVAGRTQFNIIHPDSGLKVDVMIPQADAYDAQRLARRVRVRPRGSPADAFLCSAEDVIVKKLEFYREGGSDKHLRDIAGMLKVSGDQIDRGYVDRLAAQRDVVDGWLKAQERADPVP